MGWALAVVVIAPEYPGNQGEGIVYADFFLWLPIIVAVYLLGTAGVVAARIALVRTFAAVCWGCGFGVAVSYIALGVIGVVSQSAAIILDVVLFLSINGGAFYGAWAYVFKALRGA